MRSSLIWVGLLVAAGCSDSALTDYMDDDVPAGMCDDTEGEACETGGQGDTCQTTQECGGDLVCAATFNGDIGSFECQAACIPTMEESRWCLDDDSCCDEAASCGPRGYCMIAESVDTGIDTGIDDATGESGASESSATESGTDSGTGSETATSTDTGTDSGTGTGSSTETTGG